MNRRVVMLIGILAVLAAGYGWFVLRPAAVPIEALVVQPPGAPPSFAFDRDLTLAEVRVDLVDGENVGSAPPAWHLIGDPSAEDPPEPRRTLTYGRRVRGLTTAATSGKATPLEVGQAYRLSGSADEGTFALDFVAR